MTEKGARETFSILESLWKLYCEESAVHADVHGLCKKTPGCCLKEGHGVNLHNPAVTGYNLNKFVINSEGCMRNSWPEPVEKSGTSWVEKSEADCEKNRSVRIGHNARSGLWIWVCMVDQRIVGHHVIKRSEGKRDVVLPLYRFMKKAPKVCFVDFACHAEEVSLNWLGEFFQSTRWFHDTFHGYAHKCSSRFSCKGLHDVPSSNTSIMEQVNAFLQPLRGLLKSHTTRVS